MRARETAMTTVMVAAKHPAILGLLRWMRDPDLARLHLTAERAGVTVLEYLRWRMAHLALAVGRMDVVEIVSIDQEVQPWPRSAT
jgi:hypothetical protein